MTTLVCKPTPGEGIVDKKKLYSVLMNGVDLGLRVRAKNAPEADQMIQICFQHELSGQTLNYDINQFKKGQDDGNGENEEGEEGSNDGQGQSVPV